MRKCLWSLRRKRLELDTSLNNCSMHGIWKFLSPLSPESEASQMRCPVLEVERLLSESNTTRAMSRRGPVYVNK